MTKQADLVVEMQKVAAKAQAGDEKWLLESLGLLAQLVRVGGPLSAIRIDSAKFEAALEKGGGDEEKLFENLAAQADETFLTKAVDTMMVFAAAGAQEEDERHAALLGALMLRASIAPGGARLTPVLGLLLQAQMEETLGGSMGPEEALDVEASIKRIHAIAPDLAEKMGENPGDALTQAVGLATAAFREAPQPPSIFTADELLLLITSCEDSFKKLEGASPEAMQAAFAEVGKTLEGVLDAPFVKGVHERLASIASDAGDDEESRLIGTAIWMAFLADPVRVTMLALLRGQFSPLWRDEAEVKVLDPVFGRYPWVESDLVPYHDHLVAAGEGGAAEHVGRAREILRRRAASKFGI